MPLLELRGISVGYTGEPVLHDIELTLDEGEIVTLVGANGAGKSTLVKTISGLMRPMTGEVLVEGKPITRLSPAERLKLGIAHVPEGRQIFAGMTVLENLTLGGYGVSAGASEPEAARVERVCALFPVLKDRLNDTAGNFSGGQQQMLAIARGLMSSPRILLLDEPSLGVAPLLVAEIFRLVTRLREEGLTILLAEQNARQALAIADRGYVFENGHTTLSGPAQELLDSPEIIERYLGVGAAATASDEGCRQKGARLRELLR